MFLRSIYISYYIILKCSNGRSSSLVSSNFTAHLPVGISPEQVGGGDRGDRGMFGHREGVLRDVSQLWWPSAIGRACQNSDRGGQNASPWDASQLKSHASYFRRQARWWRWKAVEKRWNGDGEIWAGRTQRWKVVKTGLP